MADCISLMRYHVKDSLTIALTDSLQQVSDSTRKDSIEHDLRTSENEETGANENAERRNRRPRPTLKEVERVSR